MEQNEKHLSIYPLPALFTPLLLIPITLEEISGCTNEAAKCANKAPWNTRSCFYISRFTISVTPSINTPKSFNDFDIIVI